MIRIIQDIHGNYDEYLKLIENVEYSIQVGDFGFNYDCLKDVDPTRHKILGGNHDNYDKIVDIPHYLGDYGKANLAGLDFFFMRGAWSVDYKNRLIGISWWKEEELSHKQCLDAVDFYAENNTSVVITHDAPIFLYPKLGCISVNRTLTNVTLRNMWNIHKPVKWFFGHHHKYFNERIGTTQFISGQKCSYYDLET